MILPEVRTLRVSILSDAISGRNGVGAYYDDLTEHLKEHLGGVVLLSASPRGSEGGWHLPLPGDPTQSLHIPPLRGVWSAVDRFSPDVIVSATPGVYGFLGWVMSVRHRVPFCFAHHTELSKLAQMYWKGRLGSLYRSIMARWDGMLFRRGDAVLVHNEELLPSVEKHRPKKVRVIGTPLPLAFLREPLAPLGPELRRVSYIGRLAPEKELGQVLRASVAHPDLEFQIVGEGPERALVDEHARGHDNVRTIRWVERKEVMSLLDSTDVLVLPSRHETFGTAAYEAMARRRLAIVSPNCGITHWPELAQGLYVMEEGEQLADTLSRVRERPASERLAVAERGHEAAKAMNGRTITDWLDVLSEVSANGRGRSPVAGGRDPRTAG